MGRIQTPHWPSLLLAVVAGIGIGAAVVLWSPSHSQTPDCRIADQAMDFIYAHRELLDAQLITTGGPDVSKYQGWSNQLQSYARQVSAPDLSRRLHRIAELSMQAVSLVQDIRKDPAVSPSSHAILDHETAYRKAVTQLVAE